jgi:large subunit ribosomal protein L6e
MYKRRGLYKKTKAVAPKKAAEAATTKTVTVGGAKNGKTRVVPLSKGSRIYPAEDAPKPKVSRKKVGKTTLRNSITPGTILVLLAGRFRGKRVVFLKQLESGLLLVSGPYKVNGVPLKRVNQAYVIATSTKVDISGVKIDAKINDDFFKKPKEEKKKEFFETPAKKTVDESKKAAQKAVDAALVQSIKKVPLLSKYLRSSFSLTSGQAPHLLKF